MEEKLRIAWYTDNTECLGPDRRFALWVQGCNKRCEGCIAQSLQDINGGRVVLISELTEKIIQSNADGITISGGEPFLQAEPLALLVEQVKKKLADIGVIIYSGMLYEELCEMTSAQKLLNFVDLLIDGVYMKELDDNKPMRGSSNQRLIFLSSKYTSDDMPKKRLNKFIFYDDKFRMIGIPSAETKRAMNIIRK